MATVANIYDSGPISPICKIKENIAVYTRDLWEYYKVVYMEGFPRSNQSTVEMVTVSGATQLAANGTIAKIQLAPLLLDEGEFLHLRFEPLDDVDGELWEQPSQAKFATRAIQCRVNLYSHLQDPWMAASTFYLLGRARLMNLSVRNPNPVIIFLARFVFWGYRYFIEQINVGNLFPGDVANLNAGDAATVRKTIGPVTWIPAEGRG